MSKTFEVTILYRVIVYRHDNVPVEGKLLEFTDVVEAVDHKNAIEETFLNAKELNPFVTLNYCSVTKLKEIQFETYIGKKV